MIDNQTLLTILMGFLGLVFLLCVWRLGSSLRRNDPPHRGEPRSRFRSRRSSESSPRDRSQLKGWPSGAVEQGEPTWPTVNRLQQR
jgi:hypothetical protein